jgi:hypothetical protein
MVRVHTGSNITGVHHYFLVGDQSFVDSIAVPMGTDHCIPITNFTIAIRSDTFLPEPTPIRLDGNTVSEMS